MGLAIIDELDRNFTNLQVLHAIENPNHPKINSLIGEKITIQKLPRKFSVDLIIDFSTPKSSINLAKIASQFRTPIVIGTTGFSKNQINQ